MNREFRLAESALIDQTRPIRFKFNGKPYVGFQGDTIASALLANGVSLIGRSLKYHRPRGVMSAGFEETNAFIQILGDREIPNVLATTTLIYEGLECESVNCWPSVRWDAGRAIAALHRLIPAGFYYKTFMWPQGSWKFYSRFIRRLAGWGKVPAAGAGLPEGRSEHRYFNCSVLVVGGGPAGIATALAAGRAGVDVLWVDDQRDPGGYLNCAQETINGVAAARWIQDCVEELDGLSNVTRLANATALGYYDGNFVTIIERNPPEIWVAERLWKVRAGRVVLATGAIERPMPFPDNDRPGIMLAGAMRVYALQFGIAPGNSVVLYTNNNGAYETAFMLAERAIGIACIIDTRPSVAAALMERASELQVPVIPAARISKVIGRRRIRAIEVMRDDHGKKTRIQCDAIGMSGGWNPLIQLQSQSGSRPIFDSVISSFVSGPMSQNGESIGACTGEFDTGACLRAGYDAGVRLGMEIGDRQAPTAEFEVDSQVPLDVHPEWGLHPEFESSQVFVDFQNDITAADIELAVRENFASVELVKRYTTAGMGMDQGKSSGVGVVGLIAALTDTDPGQVGTTSFRPPVIPVSFDALAGWTRDKLLQPWRVTPITSWFRDHSAEMVEAGSLFQRPYCLPVAGESGGDAANREARAVRAGLGIYDSSPLGKIEACGPGVAAFLDRVTTNAWEDLEVGRGRHLLLLHEDGRVLDDGLVFRLEKERYLITSSTGSASAVYRHLEMHRQLGPKTEPFHLVPVTEQWAVICVCGPRARDLLMRVESDIDWAKAAFPFMSMRHGSIAGTAARVMRVSFTGELSYEIHVPASRALALWELLMASGAAFGITPVGSNANGILRTEKGFIMPAIDGEGALNPFELRLGWAVDMHKDNFVGKRSLVRDARIAVKRFSVWGLIAESGGEALPVGSPVVEDPVNSDPDRVLGRVTASYFSPATGQVIALAQLRGGDALLGSTVSVSTVTGSRAAVVVDPVFYDPSGSRMTA